MKRIIINKELLIKFYIEENLSLKEVGDKFNVTRGTIKKELKRYNISLRNHGEKCNCSPCKAHRGEYKKETHPRYKIGKYINNYCNCGKKISPKAKQCSDCYIFTLHGKFHPWFNRKHTAESRNKISISKFGKSLNHKVDCICGICKAKRGETKGMGNPNWLGGKSFEPYPLGWNNTYKEQVRYRDGYKCQLCGKPEVEDVRKLCVHHIDYNKSNLNINNLISLCTSCHTKTNFRREVWKSILTISVPNDVPTEKKIAQTINSFKRNGRLGVFGMI